MAWHQPACLLAIRIPTRALQCVTLFSSSPHALEISMRRNAPTRRTTIAASETQFIPGSRWTLNLTMGANHPNTHGLQRLLALLLTDRALWRREYKPNVDERHPPCKSELLMIACVPRAGGQLAALRNHFFGANCVMSRKTPEQPTPKPMTHSTNQFG